MTKIGIFGGSFDPVHYGHVGIAVKAISDLKLDKLLIIPAAVSPFKTDSVRSDSIFGDRLELLKAVFAVVDKAVVDDREIRRGGVSYAIDTVREIAAENPSAEIHFIVGEDCVEGLPRWRDYEELKKLCTFDVFPRTKESSTEIRRLFSDNGVRINPDAKLAETVRSGVLRKNGYCPCRLQKLPEFFCPCDEFKSQLADPSFSGMCHCRLYEVNR